MVVMVSCHISAVPGNMYVKEKKSRFVGAIPRGFAVAGDKEISGVIRP
jgi:hypothetical protein